MKAPVDVMGNAFRGGERRITTELSGAGGSGSSETLYGDSAGKTSLNLARASRVRSSDMLFVPGRPDGCANAQGAIPSLMVAFSKDRSPPLLTGKARCPWQPERPPCSR
jgi:hypothetical protein